MAGGKNQDSCGSEPVKNGSGGGTGNKGTSKQPKPTKKK